eukprot:TRINITY_DN5106_c0_g1_i10.p1 TRINITY_DN5106_c0_g1~~TRINITY_DN5106_c0_g1_i10.p1  ORF type:complete len:256 (+),score=72.52 TRINITY_DN5106_c0_g1_i10:94-861(+)
MCIRDRSTWGIVTTIHPAPYIFGNSSHIFNYMDNYNEETARFICNPDNFQHFNSLIGASYKRFLKCISSQDLVALRRQSEHRLFCRTLLALKEIRMKQYTLAVINEEAPLKVKILHGKFVKGGYINRRTERKAELKKESVGRKVDSSDIIWYKGEREKRYANSFLFLMNLTAQITSKMKLVRAQPGILHEDVEEEKDEVHYITTEGVMFSNRRMKHESDLLDIHDLNFVSELTVVDFDYALKGNAHMKETKLKKN